MQQSSSPYDSLEVQSSQGSRLVEMFCARLVFSLGLGFWVSLFLRFALATWNVADPSLTHATTNEIINSMGWTGAIFSDFFMQFFGLASLGVLLPPLFWSFLLLAQKNIHNLIFRLFLWVVSTTCFLISFALMTPLAPFTNWPLPMGLGGVLGDKVLSVASLIFSVFLSPFQSVLLGIALIFLSFLMAAFAGNVIWRRRKIKKLKTFRRMKF